MLFVWQKLIGFDNQVGRWGRDVDLVGCQVGLVGRGGGGGGGGGVGWVLPTGNAFLPFQLPDGICLSYIATQLPRDS